MVMWKHAEDCVALLVPWTAARTRIGRFATSARLNTRLKASSDLANCEPPCSGGVTFL